jgi:hypothetical protein
MIYPKFLCPSNPRSGVPSWDLSQKYLEQVDRSLAASRRAPRLRRHAAVERNPTMENPMAEPIIRSSAVPAPFAMRLDLAGGGEAPTALRIEVDLDARGRLIRFRLISPDGVDRGVSAWAVIHAGLNTQPEMRVNPPPKADCPVPIEKPRRAAIGTVAPNSPGEAVARTPSSADGGCLGGAAHLRSKGARQ